MVPGPVMGVIVLFPDQKVKGAESTFGKDKEAKEAKSDGKDDGKKDATGAFHMKQIAGLGNACGTIAMIHAVLNNLDKITYARGRANLARHC